MTLNTSQYLIVNIPNNEYEVKFEINLFVLKYSNFTQTPFMALFIGSGYLMVNGKQKMKTMMQYFMNV